MGQRGLTNVKRVWCIGYSNRKPEELLEVLRKNGIELLIDIRRFPTSKVEAYRGENISKLLKREGIAYRWLGNLLGGYRRGGFEAYMKTREFAEGLETVVREASKRRVCLMCLERRQRYCHRRFIAEALRRMEFEVSEIP